MTFLQHWSVKLIATLGETVPKIITFTVCQPKTDSWLLSRRLPSTKSGTLKLGTSRGAARCWVKFGLLWFNLGTETCADLRTSVQLSFHRRSINAGKMSIPRVTSTLHTHVICMSQVHAVPDVKRKKMAWVLKSVAYIILLFSSAVDSTSRRLTTSSRFSVNNWFGHLWLSILSTRRLRTNN